MNRLPLTWFWILTAIIFLSDLNIDLFAQGASDGGVSSMLVFKPVKEIFANDEGYYRVDGSDGLTLNITLLTTIKLTDKSNFEINMGLPLITRDVQLEGLMRSFVIGGEYVSSF